MLKDMSFCVGDLCTLTFDPADQHWLVERNNYALESHITAPALAEPLTPKKRRLDDEHELDDDDEMPLPHCYDDFNGKARTALRRKVLATANSCAGASECQAARDKASAALLKRDAFVQ